MLVVRYYGTAKRDRVSDAIAYLKGVSADMSETVRIYEPFVGDNDVVGIEIEFEDLAHYERWNKENFDNPEGQENLKEWFEVTTANRNEILRLVK